MALTVADIVGVVKPMGDLSQFGIEDLAATAKRPSSSRSSRKPEPWQVTRRWS